MPEGVDDDVGDGVKRSVAVAGVEQAVKVLVRAPQFVLGQPGKSLQIVSMDGGEKRTPQSRQQRCLQLHLCMVVKQ